jgi:hypothetical protein
MRIDIGSICRKLAPLAALAMAGGLSGCSTSINIDGEEGKKLSELDMTGEAPTKLVMAGPDHVKVSEGAKLAITVDGDPKAADHLRFTLKDGTLGILRAKSWSEGGAVTINVTMPAPQDVTLAGSGTIDANALAKDAKVTVAGSGDVNAGTLSGDSFKLTVAGSGTMRGGGAVKDLDMTIAGSGSADLAALRADHAKVTIAGSGNATMMSDGDVSATIMGSGTVTVKGRASCKVSSMGSGKLVCESGPAQTSDAPDADDTDDAGTDAK